MNDASQNPYASPAIHDERSAARSRIDLRPLWIWLNLNMTIGIIAVPADPVSLVVAFAFGLAFFCAGSILASSLHIALRSILLAMLVVPVICSAFISGLTLFAIGCFLYALVSIYFGHLAHRSISIGRTRIFASFYVAYVVGTFFGIFGMLGLPLIATYLAKRSALLTVTTDDGSLESTA